MEKPTKLQSDYEKVCHAYMETFLKKQGMTDYFWAGDIIGGITFVEDYFFNFNDIVWDINSNQPKGTILNWHNENIANPEKSINYFSYTKGLRNSDL